jgi:hypothetical protein
MRRIISIRFVLAALLSPARAFVSNGPNGSVERRLAMTSSEQWNLDPSLSRREAFERATATSFTAAASGLLIPSLARADGSVVKSPSQTICEVPTVRLGGGKSSLEVSRTIQGYWQLAGGHGTYREIDAVANMQAHINAGVTTLDTADIYGPSELIVGKCVKSQPKAIPCTKFCCFRYLEVRRHWCC